MPGWSTSQPAAGARRRHRRDDLVGRVETEDDRRPVGVLHPYGVRAGGAQASATARRWYSSITSSIDIPMSGNGSTTAMHSVSRTRATSRVSVVVNVAVLDPADDDRLDQVGHAVTLRRDRAPVGLLEASVLTPRDLRRQLRPLVVQVRCDERADDGVELIASVGAGRFDLALQARQHHVVRLVEELAQEIELAREVVVERGHAHARLGRDVPRGGPLVALPAHQRDRGPHQHDPAGPGSALAAGRRDAARRSCHPATVARPSFG